MELYLHSPYGVNRGNFTDFYHTRLPVSKLPGLSQLRSRRQYTEGMSNGKAWWRNCPSGHSSGARFSSPHLLIHVSDISTSVDNLQLGRQRVASVRTLTRSIVCTLVRSATDSGIHQPGQKAPGRWGFLRTRYGNRVTYSSGDLWVLERCWNTSNLLGCYVASSDITDVSRHRSSSIFRVNHSLQAHTSLRRHGTQVINNIVRLTEASGGSNQTTFRGLTTFPRAILPVGRA
jgi:hypothetical protein